MQTIISSEGSNDIRRRAEKIAQEKTTDINAKALSSEEMQYLLHELQVHQIELEMQNDELRRIHDELDVSKQKYFELYDLAPVGYFSINMEGLILETNLTGATLLGVERNELINKNIKRFIIKDDQDIYYIHNKTLFETGEPQMCELRMKHRNSSFIWVRLDGNISHNAQNTEPVSRVIVIDITELKQLEQEHLQTQKQILNLQKYESLDLMAGGIAHDFNNILTALMGRIELTLMDSSLSEPSKQNLNKAMESSHHAANLTSQILSYSGHGLFQVKDVDITILIQGFNEMLSAAVSKKVAISYDLAEGLPAVKADKAHIMQIIMNLFINASEAIGDKTGHIRISTGAVKCSREYLESVFMNQQLPEGNYAYIEVEDTGCGINKENLEKVFDPFFTTKFIGRGLGLAAVIGLVKSHNGTIKIESKPGKGSIFRVLLPAEDYSIPRAKPHVPFTTASVKTKILLVDDEEVVRDVGVSMLNHLGYSVLTATNGEEAIKVFKENILSSKGHDDRIGCVILDLSMPRMNGEETLPVLIEMDPDIPVVIASGYSENVLKKRFENKGAVNFLQKPYHLSTLNDKIQKALSGVKAPNSMGNG